MNLLIITQKVDQNDQLLGFFVDWIRLFAERFKKVTVICLEKGEFNLPDNVEVFSLGKESGALKLRQLSTFYFLLSTLKYDAVFAHMNPIWIILGGPLWRLTGKKVFFWYTSGGVTPKLKIAEKFSNIIFTASKESFRLASKKVIITGHGIDTGLFRPSEKWKVKSGKWKILSVGRIAPVKNYETLIEAAKILKDQKVDFEITIVGESPPLQRDKEYERNLRFKISDFRLEDYFNFAGKVNHRDLPQYYQSHDVFVHMSKTGSLDKTILEAMACGMKVLSSNDSSRAFLKESMIFDNDNPEDLAEKVKNLRNTDYGEELRNYALEHHNLENLIKKISIIIHDPK